MDKLTYTRILLTKFLGMDRSDRYILIGLLIGADMAAFHECSVSEEQKSIRLSVWLEALGEELFPESKPYHDDPSTNALLEEVDE